MPEMPQHSDEQQDADMIKMVLQKVIDEMNSMESDRIAPKPHTAVTIEHSDVKPMDGSTPDMSKAPGLFLGAGIPNPNENKAERYDQAEPETLENQHEPLDPEVLKELLDKASHADDEGGTHDDYLDEFDPDVAAAIRKRKKS